jgi:hypothetical protein
MQPSTDIKGDHMNTTEAQNKGDAGRDEMRELTLDELDSIGGGRVGTIPPLGANS